MSEQSEIYTEAEALDVAVMQLVRKLRRMHPDAFKAIVIDKLSEGAQLALTLAEYRGDATMETPEGRRFKTFPGLITEEEDDGCGD